MSHRTEAFVERLADSVPPLREMLADNKQRHGAQAPRAFLRTVAQVLPSRYFGGDPVTADEYRRVLDFLDHEFGKDDEIDTLIAESFLAHLPAPDDFRAKALELLGPALRAELDRQRRGEGIPVRSPEKELVRRLVEAEPSLQEVLRAHLDFSGELLPHPFMADVTRKVVEWSRSGDDADLARMRAVLQFLDTEFGRDFLVDELIAVSFIENLRADGEPGHEIVAALGPKLRAEFDRQRSP